MFDNSPVVEFSQMEISSMSFLLNILENEGIDVDSDTEPEPDGDDSDDSCQE